MPRSHLASGHVDPRLPVSAPPLLSVQATPLHRQPLPPVPEVYIDKRIKCLLRPTTSPSAASQSAWPVPVPLRPLPPPPEVYLDTRFKPPRTKSASSVQNRPFVAATTLYPQRILEVYIAKRFKPLDRGPAAVVAPDDARPSYNVGDQLKPGRIDRLPPKPGALGLVARTERSYVPSQKRQKPPQRRPEGLERKRKSNTVVEHAEAYDVSAMPTRGGFEGFPAPKRGLELNRVVTISAGLSAYVKFTHSPARLWLTYRSQSCLSRCRGPRLPESQDHLQSIRKRRNCQAQQTYGCRDPQV